MANIYWVFGYIAIIYGFLLLLVNQIPHITIKYIGFLSLRGITIRLKNTKITINKINISVNLLGSSESKNANLFSLDIVDVGVTCLRDKSKPKQKSKSKSKIPLHERSIKEELFFKIPKFIYQFFIKTKIINRVNFQVHRLSIYHQETHENFSTFLEFLRLETNILKESNLRFTATLYNAMLYEVGDENNKIQYFRNAEFFINCIFITACPINVKDKITLYFQDFETSLSISRLNIPLNLLSKNRDRKSKEPDTSNDNDDSQRITNVLQYTNLVKEIISIYSTTTIRLEDFTLVHDDLKFNLSNFAFSLDKVEREDENDQLKLLLYLTSFKFYHLESKCFELPSGTITYQVCPLEMLRVTQVLLKHEESSNEFINFETNITLTNPTFDFYYDQQDILFKFLRDQIMSRRMKKMTSAAGVRRKEEALLKLKIASKLIKSVSSKIIIVDTDLNIHLPKIGDNKENEFNRFSKNNTVLKLSLSGFIHRLFTRSHTKGRHTVNSLIKIKNLKGEEAGNILHFSKINILAAYDLADGKLGLRLSSKSIKIRSVNDIFFYLVRQFRNQQIIYFNKKFDELKHKDQLKVEEPTSVNEETSTKGDSFIKLFKIIPPFISSVKLSVTSILIDIVCKEGLPSHKVYDENLGKEIDLKDYRRGVSLKVDEINAGYKLNKELLESSVKLVQVFTLSEYSSEYMDDFDKVTEMHATDSELDEMSSINSLASNPITSDDFNDDNGTRRIKTVLTVNDIYITNDSVKEDRDVNRLSLTIPDIEGRIDMFFLWCMFYAKTMLERFAPTIARKCTKNEIKKMTGPRKKVKLDITIDSFATVIRLPNKVDVLIEFEFSRLNNALVLKNADVRNIRLYVVHPATKLWARLLVIKQPNFSIDLSKTLHDASFELLTKSVRFDIPYQFLFFTVIDNFISFFKAIKQLKHNFTYFNYGAEEFERVFPSAKQAIKFPHINLKTSVLGLSLENDPFENELELIFELGVIEQKERLRKLKAFESKAKEMLANAEPDIEHQIELSKTPAPKPPPVQQQDSTCRFHSPLRHESSSSGHENGGGKKIKETFMKLRKHHSQTTNKSKEEYCTDSQPKKPRLTMSQAEDEIKKARDRLNQNFALSWTRKFEVMKKVRGRLWQQRMEDVWGKDEITETMKNKYDIVAYPHGPPMAGAVFRDVNLTLDRFRGGDIDEFLYKFAKKQPKLTYSILCPMYLNLKSRKFYMILRDYPLPLASFPTASNPQNPTINIEANIIINEHLFSRQEELRYIFVPYSLAATDPNSADNFYSVNIPRTLTPVKVAADFNCDLITDRACTISWCKAYQPALGAMGQAFENFTKPAIDDSPIGFWDKVPLIMHGKYQFNVANELCLLMKSGTSPTKLVGRDSGFAFCWKDNVSLCFDGTIDPKNFIVITSDDFIFAIPNYSIEEKNIWSLFYDGADVTTPDYDLDAKKFHKKVIKLSTNDRVKWVLGFMFERNKLDSKKLCDEEPRTRKFKPHYDVVVTNPINKYHPDSYEGYRSDYVHMALSVISKSHNGEAYNAAYLTPLTFHHFFYWWDTIAHYSPLPTRNGKLFAEEGKKKVSVKFSPHIFTVKYLMVFNPVTISHLYIHSSNEMHNQKNRVAFTGLKGKFKICEIDLHQAKELMTYVNKKLNRKTQVKHLKMNQAEINIEEADIRVLNALFHDQSISGKLMSYLTGDLQSSNSSTNSDAPKFSKWIESIDIPDGDYSWVDPEDFIELEVEPLSPNPKIRILPFFYTPKFTYFREFTLKKKGPFPFGNEPIHDCIMDLEKPAAVQTRILDERKKTLNKEVEKLKASFSDPNAQNIDKQHLENEINLLQDKIQVLEEAGKNFTENDLKLTQSFDEGDHLSLERQMSGLSAYTSHTSQSELLEASNVVAVAEFHNRFILHNLKLIWDDDLKEYFISYLKRISDRKNHVYYMTKTAVDLVQSVINENGPTDDASIKFQDQDNAFKNFFKDGCDVIESFNEELEKINSDDEEPEFKYLIKLIHPQIQMISKKVPDSCVILTSKDLDIRIVDVNVKDMTNIMTDSSDMITKVESRYGVLFKEESIFVIYKDDVLFNNPKTKFAKNGYMSRNNWPPWFECEVCYNGSWAQDYLVSERNTISLIYKNPNQLFLSSNHKDSSSGSKVNIYLAKYVIDATSEQYSSIYYVITELLISDGKKDTVNERLSRVISIADRSDFKGLDLKVKELQSTIREFKDILLNFDQKGGVLSDEEKRYLKLIELEMEKSKLELLMIFKTVKMKNKKKEGREWYINIHEFIWHMLDDMKNPYVDIAASKASFNRTESVDGTNINSFEVSMMQMFNLQNHSSHPIILSPSNPSITPIVKFSWEMLANVGGIALVKDCKLEMQGLIIDLDYNVGKQIHNYLFPGKNDDNDDDESSSDSDESISDESQTSVSTRSSSPWRKMTNGNSIFSNIKSSSSSISSYREKKAQNKVDQSFKRKPEQDELDVLIERSLKYRSIINFTIEKMDLEITVTGASILNCNNLKLQIPKIQINNQILSVEEFSNIMKNNVIKIILKNSTKIINNKFKIQRKNNYNKPIKQINHYSGYKTLEDLENEGERIRDEVLPHHLNGHHHKPAQKHHMTRHYSHINDDEIYDNIDDSEIDPSKDKVEGDIDAP
ncbi:uncharacterized protein KGF55_001308 [Candida pseudojiufengensis]|uniref:uncharacterized protein n=1 Tax=Candida pseudojiufengensis TaxID=497109 RepID=UPI0022250AA4|nr:uncharacterized protein KGF55_001308 [Candida pseudojiufengensis]KAI5965944.1 hypothetical protein KGF55_001308 [Candida pseudojiufengensis]